MPRFLIGDLCVSPLRLSLRDERNKKDYLVNCYDMWLLSDYVEYLIPGVDFASRCWRLPLYLFGAFGWGRM